MCPSTHHATVEILNSNNSELGICSYILFCDVMWLNAVSREELPNIYKCPYQGCTAVYRAPDGLKVRIHERNVTLHHGL